MYVPRETCICTLGITSIFDDRHCIHGRVEGSLYCSFCGPDGCGCACGPCDPSTDNHTSSSSGPETSTSEGPPALTSSSEDEPEWIPVKNRRSNKRLCKGYQSRTCNTNESTHKCLDRTCSIDKHLATALEQIAENQSTNTSSNIPQDKEAAYVHGFFEELEIKDENLFLNAWKKAEESWPLNQ